MSQGKRNFIVGISLILVAIMLIGCLPNKQGGFTCVCAPLVSKIRSMLPGQKPKPPDSQPDQVPANPSSPSQVPANPSSPSQGGDVSWWQTLPDLKQEEVAINTRIGGLRGALAARNVEGVLNYFQADEREEYRTILKQSPDAMPKIAADLARAKISFLSAESTQYSRVAEYSTVVDGHTFYFQFIKIDGQWMLETL